MKKLLLLSLLFTLLQSEITDKILYRFETKCMVCHNLYKKNKLAPPLVAVNQVYLRLNDNNQTRAVEQMKQFLLSPQEKKGLMKPAVKLFGVMPKLDLNVTEIEDFVEVVVQTEFEIPNWFNAHYRQHELNGTK
jgi:Leucine-rich repeat (LRR) protein